MTEFLRLSREVEAANLLDLSVGHLGRNSPYRLAARAVLDETKARIDAHVRSCPPGALA